MNKRDLRWEDQDKLKAKQAREGDMATETKAKATPGPWTTKDSTQVYSGGRHVADCGSRNPEGLPRHIGLEDAANARLIAAVPCLLEALIKMIDHAQEQHPHFESERGMADINRSIQAVEKGLEIKWGDVRLKQ